MFVDLILSSSTRTLQEIMLARFDRAAAFRKELLDLVERYAESQAQAETARLLMDLRRGLHKNGTQQRFEFPSEVKIKKQPAFAPRILDDRRRRG